MGELLYKSDMTQDQMDALDLAGAFQAASDDDTRKVMNAMSDASQNANFYFYIVPAAWFRAAYPILTARSSADIPTNWRDTIGPIANAELLSHTDAEIQPVPASNAGGGVAEVQRKRFDQLHNRGGNNRSLESMRVDLTHKEDYFFVGPSAWMLVKEKFDFDGYELKRPCIPVDTKTSHGMAIRLHAEESEGGTPRLIQIPPSGRFPYEMVITKGVPQSSSTTASNGDNSTPESSFVLVPSPWDGNNDQEEDVQSSQDPPVLLLPPSTTSPISNVDGSDMDVESKSNRQAVAGRKRLASGLGNLGNTCFMNSSLQCLAHTNPLRRYFLSGEYANDLNRDNPLGTGGELASQFAELISEMWGVQSKRRNVMGVGENSYIHSSSSAIYPRSFKVCLGRHAEQFVGYDQHDSQELATYLLDALHEDTNRVTKKPYIEKPEQGEDEPDEVAADKAWALHLQREDSRVLESFMGQVKSRLECCQEGCSRVSTTFDPFMYLSVPIPGATERTIEVTFVPLDPSAKRKVISLTLNKASTIRSLLSKLNGELVEHGVLEGPLRFDDMCAADVFSRQIYKTYSLSTDIDVIRNDDVTFVFQLEPFVDVQKKSKEAISTWGLSDLPDLETHKYVLDIPTITRLNGSDYWQTEMEHYVEPYTMLLSAFNPRRGTVEECVQLTKKVVSFLEQCHRVIARHEAEKEKEKEEQPEPESEVFEVEAEAEVDNAMDEIIAALLDCCNDSPTFKNVRSRHDVAVLEFCLRKLRQYILRKVTLKQGSCRDGVEVNVIMTRPQPSGKIDKFVQPFVMRFPASTTVYNLREMLAARLSRSISPSSDMASDDTDCPPEMMAMRQVFLAWSQDTNSGAKASADTTFGMVKRADIMGTEQGDVLADPNNEAEKELIAKRMGPKGTIFVDWPMELCDKVFNVEEFESSDCLDDEKVVAARKAEAEKVTNVLDCIKKYCQMEQLEETEMWYCNRCKDHVRAWKQFHLYRTPPILIVHLKRFHYSASTHRREKITSFIDFPLVGLNLTGLVSHFKPGEEPIYDCYAVSNHYGGLGGGHYTAYTLSDDGTWCHYDDSRVTNDISISEVVSEAAYVLYYRRRDVTVGQDYVDVKPPSEFVSEAEDDADDALASSLDSMNAHVVQEADVMSLDSPDEVDVEPDNGRVVSFNMEEYPPLQ
eukprot:Nitzschia sp. Nitz4//scaffold1_size375055//313508//317176//NITZ4_000326-RA/size375055-processed-gene-0.464-mRNA-1//-1//CDS//3329541195//3876//frame0